MPEELNPDTNFKIIDKRSPDTQARKAEMPDHIRDVKEMILTLCPACGGDAEIVKEDLSEDCRVRVRCRDPECLMHGIWFWFPSAILAISAWNRRTPEPGTSVIREDKNDTL